MTRHLERADDRELVERARLGQGAAFGELVRRYRDEVFRVVRCTASLDPHRVEDAAQEVFLRAWRGLEGFRGDASFRTWLLRIAVNTTLKEVEKIRNRPPPPRGADPLEGPREPVDDGAPPWARLLDEERLRAVREALARLDEVFRTAVVLRDVDGLSYEEISEILGVPVGTVRSRIHRGRREIRRMIAGEDVPADRDSGGSPRAAGDDA